MDLDVKQALERLRDWHAGKRSAANFRLQKASCQACIEADKLAMSFHHDAVELLQVWQTCGNAPEADDD